MLNENLPTSEIKLNQVLHGKNQDVLKDFPSNYFSSVITDPPYEIGFCQRKWDATGIAYSVDMWREVLRVSKPGTTLFCFAGTRTAHRVACAIEDAGWVTRNTIMYIFGSGFPKSLDISKALKKMGEESLAEQWQGYGTDFKPAYENILCAMAPLEKGLTYAQNARKWGVAGLNIDAGRISGIKGVPTAMPNDDHTTKGWDANAGRWPANVILSHSPDCVQVGVEKVKCSVLNSSHTIKKQSMFNAVKEGQEYHSYADENGQETIDVYACVPGCPIRIMDTQSGKLGKLGKSAEKKQTGHKHDGSWATDFCSDAYHPGYGDSGGASRFFYTAKASRSERESGLKDFVPCVECGETGTEQHTLNGVTNNCIRNNHPTTKPVSIMDYLCRLIKMPERKSEDGSVIPQVILDPFCGSGTTLLAAEANGMKYIGIDMIADHVILSTLRSIEPEMEDVADVPAGTDKISEIAEQLSENDFGDLLI